MRGAKTMFILLAALGLTIRCLAQPATNSDLSNYRTSTISRTDGSSLKYYWYAPGKDKKSPLLLYLDGSGCRSVSGILPYLQPFVELGFIAATLEKRGVQSSDSGERCSDEYLSTNDRNQRVADADLLISKASENFPQWDHRLVIIGASEGGALAPEVALKHAETVALVSLAGGGWPQAEELKKLRHDELVRAHASRVKIRKNLLEMERQFREMVANPTPKQTWMGEDNTYKRWASYLYYSPAEYLVRLSVPVYMAHGTADNAAPFESAYAVAQRFRELGKGNLVFRRYDGLDHNWTDSAGQNHTQEVIQDLINWVGQISN